MMYEYNNNKKENPNKIHDKILTKLCDKKVRRRLSDPT